MAEDTDRLPLADDLGERDALTRIESHVGGTYNTPLREARLQSGMLQRELAEAASQRGVELTSGAITQIEALRLWPSEVVRQALAGALAYPEPVLFPQWLRVYVFRQYPMVERQRDKERAEAMIELGNELQIRRDLETHFTDEVELRMVQPLVREAIDVALRKLKPVHRRMVELRFGLTGQPPMTYGQIAQEFGVTRSYPQQVISYVLRQLRYGNQHGLLMEYYRLIPFE